MSDCHCVSLSLCLSIYLALGLFMGKYLCACPSIYLRMFFLVESSHTRVDESCTTHEHVMSKIFRRHVTHVDKACLAFVMSQMWVRHVCVSVCVYKLIPRYFHRFNVKQNHFFLFLNPVCLSLCLSFCLSVCLSIYLTLGLSICRYICGCPSICLHMFFVIESCHTRVNESCTTHEHVMSKIFRRHVTHANKACLTFVMSHT